MDPQSQKYRVKFNDGSDGFRYFFKDKDLLDYLSSKSITCVVKSIEQYDRKTNSFKSIEQ
jgi:hypothetical protein